jgi:zinc transporter ZupT
MMSYLLLLGSVVLGAILGTVLKSHKNFQVKFLLTFSGAYLLSIGIFHLLPEIFESHDHYIGLWIMGGFFIQLVLEVFSKGIEHGHSHVEWFQKRGIPLTIIVSLFIHALLESLPVGAHHEELSKNAMLWGIVIHKMPVSLILFTMLTEVQDSKWRVYGVMLLFALVAPLGVYLGSHLIILQEYYRELTALTFGLFVHISTTILFESDQSHQFHLKKFITVILAVFIAWFSVSH